MATYDSDIGGVVKKKGNRAVQLVMPDVNTVLSGYVAPSDKLGEEGDFYINASTWEIYGPKEDIWGEPLSLIGPIGPEGRSIKGDKGDSIVGPQGPMGLPGKDGEPGVQGPKGEDGQSIVGPKGEDGRDGVDGKDGKDGREVELGRSQTHIQWRYKGEKEWHDLMPIPQAVRGKSSGGANAVKYLQDAEIKNVTDGQVLKYDAAKKKWVNATGGGSGGQASIQFKDEGVNRGTLGAIASVDFTGAGVTASAVGTNLTVNIPGGGSATPAGSNTQVQYNDSGSFGANANFTYSASTGEMTLGASTNNGKLTVNRNGTSFQEQASFWNNNAASGVPYIWVGKTAVAAVDSGIVMAYNNILNAGNISLGGDSPSSVGLFIKRNSFIGVGNPNPGYNMDVTGTANVTAGFRAGNGYFSWDAANHFAKLSNPNGGGSYLQSLNVASADLTALFSNGYYTAGLGFVQPSPSRDTWGFVMDNRASSSTFRVQSFPAGSSTARENLIVDGNGKTRIGNTAYAAPVDQLQVEVSGPTVKGFTVKGAAAQTANLIEANVNGGTTLFGVGAAGTVIANGSVGTSGQVLTSSGAGAPVSWTTVSGGGATSAVTKAIAQTVHGRSVGQLVYLSGSTYTIASSNATGTADVVGLVSAVADANNFTLTTHGYVTGLSGLTAGTTYFLSSTGTLSSTPGTVNKPIFIADSSTSGYVINLRGLTGGVGPGTPGQITFRVDNGSTAITTGAKKLYQRVAFNCVITGWEIVADTSGSIVFDIWKDTYANFPPTVADTITGSAKPTLSAAVKAQSSTLTGWATTLNAGDYLEINVDSASTVTMATLNLLVTRT